MKIQRPAQNPGGFTLVELLLVIAIIAILAALLLPSLSRGRMQSHRAVCTSNLRQIGIAFHSFAHDHGDHFPMRVPQRDGGSQEFVLSDEEAADQFQFAYQHFLPLSGMLVTPRILICPSDTRLPAPNFAEFGNANLSYFVALNAEFGKTTMILAGDRNLTNAAAGAGSSYQVGTNNLVHWTGEMHQWKGNLLFADGHVERANGLRLVSSPKMNFAVASLAVPTKESPMTAGAAGGASEFADGGELPAAGTPVQDGSSNDTPGLAIQSSSGLGIIPLAPVRSPPSSASAVVTNGSATNAASPAQAPIATVAVELVETDELPAREAAKPLVQALRPFSKWLWLLLLLLLAVMGARFWRAWRRYQES